MHEKIEPIDVTDRTPELRKLAEDVREARHPFVLRIDGEDVAIVAPAHRIERRATREKSAADMAAFWSSFGGWKDVDTDKLIEDIYASRRISTRPPVDL